MGQMIRLDSRGHGPIAKWDAEKIGEVKAAQAVFAEHQANGYTMFRMDGPAEGQKMGSFDPEAQGIVAVPRMQGG